MEALITIKEQNGSKVCSARELHKFLVVESENNVVGEDFSNWIKRMLGYGFVENQDYTLINYNYKGQEISESDNQHVSKREYALTLDTAKEISMLQRNDKGKQARQYFIEVEKKQKPTIDFSNPNAVLQLAQNWANEHNLRLEAEKKIEKLQPKAELMDKLTKIDANLTLSQTAKALQLGYGRNTLAKKLREIGLFFKNTNEPKQNFVDRGLFLLKETIIKDSEIYLQVFVTQKGLLYLYEKLNQKKVVLNKLKVYE